MSCALFKL